MDMPTEIKLPELGENLTSGDVLEVRVKPGDEVKEGQTLLEVEAEKSTVEVPSPVTGMVAKVLVNKGDTIQVGQTLAAHPLHARPTRHSSTASALPDACPLHYSIPYP